MNEKKSYGLTNKNKYLNEDIFRNLARLLFFSQSNSVEDVNLFLEKTNTKTAEELLEYMSLLENEINIVKETYPMLKEDQHKISEKLMNWIDAFDSENVEIKEYINFYKLSPDLIEKLFMV